MKLRYLKIEPHLFSTELGKEPAMQGTAEFQGVFGKVVVRLMESDVEEIEELLRAKLIPLREEI